MPIGMCTIRNREVRKRMGPPLRISGPWAESKGSPLRVALLILFFYICFLHLLILHVPQSLEALLCQSKFDEITPTVPGIDPRTIIQDILLMALAESGGQ